MLYSRRSSLAYLLILLSLAARAWGAAFIAEGYTVRVWQTDDGLPQNMVTCAVQTRDGYLWFGTYSGLTRFDGERFTVFDPVNTPSMPDRRVSRLLEDAEGTLWVGHDSGIVTRFRDGRFEPAEPHTGGIGDGRVIGLGSDERGRRWVMHESGRLNSWDDQTHIPSLIPRGERPAVMSYSSLPRGNIWVSENGQAAHLTDGRLVPATLPLPQTTNYVLCVAAANDGGAWILCDDRIRKWDGARWTEDRGPFPWPKGGVACALELRDGTLAIGTLEAGLHLVFPDGRKPAHFDAKNGLPQNWVRFLCEDREGNLWAGAGSAGLVSIHASPFSVLSLPEETHGCSALSVATDAHGALWIGTDGAGLYRYANGRWQHYGPTEGLANWYVPVVAVGPDGSVWASDFWWGGPYRLVDGCFKRLVGIAENAHPAYALLPLPGGELLIGNRDGLRRWRDGDSTWLAKAPGTAAPEACAIARDPAGNIWCGFAGGGLARITGNETRLFRRADGLASDAVTSLCVDDEGTLWVGTADRGLSRFKDGRFTSVGREHGLADSSVCAILDDGQGYLWLSTHHGLQRIAKTELHRCADGATATFASQIYDRNDGLPIIEFTSGFQSVACKTADGRLWFACGKGLVSVDPARIESNPLPPPVVIDSLWTDGQPAPVLAGRVANRLPPDHERLEFRFSALSFVAPSKVLFRYRLDGIDRDWIDAGSKRSAFYSQLPAGDYRLRVIACNNDGLWNLEGATLAFTVAPFFWQTGWFLTLCAFATGGAVAWIARAVTRRRMQRQIEAMERQHELERERARIAQDIHDDVGASLSRIAMLSQPARADLAEPERTAALLTRIYATAREVTRSLDEIVWAVDPRHDTLDSLVDYMGKFAQSFLAPARLRCRLDLPVQVPTWPLTAEVRHNLFLAFKEALNNAAKHACATEVRFAFRVGADSFVIEVKDNGRGFTPAAAPAGAPDRVVSGHGLANMQARLARIGGRCEIASEAGQGTSVSFVVSVGSPPPPSAPSPV